MASSAAGTTVSPRSPSWGGSPIAASRSERAVCRSSASSECHPSQTKTSSASPSSVQNACASMMFRPSSPSSVERAESRRGRLRAATASSWMCTSGAGAASGSSPAGEPGRGARGSASSRARRLREEPKVGGRLEPEETLSRLTGEAATLGEPTAAARAPASPPPPSAGGARPEGPSGAGRGAKLTARTETAVDTFSFLSEPSSSRWVSTDSASSASAA